MSNKNRQSLVSDIDAFMKQYKTLEADEPIWTDSERPHEIVARWPILEDGGISRAHLAFRLCRTLTEQPSISVIFEGEPCYRIDVKPDDVCEPNPTWARNHNLPAQVCGTHCHPWEVNRAFLLNGANPWQLQARRKVSQNTRKVPHALAVLADDVRITLTGGQRLFDAPKLESLF